MERTFWGVIVDRLVKAALLSIALTGVVGQIIYLLLEYKVVTL